MAQGISWIRQGRVRASPKVRSSWMNPWIRVQGRLSTFLFTSRDAEESRRFRVPGKGAFPRTFWNCSR